MSISSFVTITGNFGFEENSGGIEAAANSVTALLSAGPASVGVTGGTLALLLNNDGTKVLEASGALQFSAAGCQRERDEGFGGLEHDDDGLQREPADGDQGDQRDDPRGSGHAERGGDGLSVSISSFVTITRGNFRVRGELGRHRGGGEQRDGLAERRSGECRGDRRDIGPAVEQRRDEGVGGLGRAAVQRGGLASASATVLVDWNTTCSITARAR